jgi:hypothetical protein
MAKIKLADLINEAGTNVKSLGAGKMQHANTRTNLGRHRSSDELDKRYSKDHEKNTIKGTKAANYIPPHMREDEMEEGSPFDYAALQARKNGQESFNFAGEKFPVKKESSIKTTKRFKDNGENFSITYHGLENTKGGQQIESGIFDILRSGKGSEQEILKLVKKAFIRYKKEY